jgi:hypothetical protein
MKLHRALIPAALVLVALSYYAPLWAQPPDAATSPGVPVTTPAAASAPQTDKPAPNVSVEKALPVQEVPSPASPTHLTAQAFWAVLAAYALQNAKRFKFIPWWNDHLDGRVQAAVGFATALATAAGIHFYVTGSFLDGGASITITGLSLDAFKDVAWQWVAQQIAYDKLVKDNIRAV